MPFPPDLGMGDARAARLASQAAWFVRRWSGGRAIQMHEFREYMRVRAPGFTDRQLRWALGIGQRLSTAQARAEKAGPKATMGSLFRGNKGLSPGYAVTVSVTVTTPTGTTRTGSYVITNVTNSDLVSDILRKAEFAASQSARQQRGRGRYPSCWRPIEATSIVPGSIESEIVGFVPTTGGN